MDFADLLFHAFKKTYIQTTVQNPIYKVNFYEKKSKIFQNSIRFLLAETILFSGK